MTHRLTSWFSRNSFYVLCPHVPSSALSSPWLPHTLVPTPFTHGFQKSSIFALPNIGNATFLLQIKIFLFFFPALPFKGAFKLSQSQGLRAGRTLRSFMHTGVCTGAFHKRGLQVTVFLRKTSLRY